MIEMKDVYKTYPNGVFALMGFTFTLSKVNLFMSLVRVVQENQRLLK